MLADIIQRLEAEVEALNYELSVTLPETLERAIANGDLRENGDYHAALERQGFVSARLSQLRGRLVKISQIDIAKIPADKIGLGSRVEVRDLDTDDTDQYELVIPDAMDLDLGHVSVASPLGSALVNRKVGDETEVRLPMGTRRLKVLAIKTLHDLASEGLTSAD
jgi:transcription elongation factor GreA